MATQSATDITLQDEGTVGVGLARLGLATDPRQAASEVFPPGAFRLPGVSIVAWQRWALLLSDVASAALALVILHVTTTGGGSLAAPGVAMLALLLVRLTGVYGRGALRLAASSLDEAPELLTLTGLSAVAIAIMQPTLTGNSLDGSQLAITWAGLFVALAAGRIVVRAVRRHVTPRERCVVIGDLDQARRIDARLQMTGAHASVIAAVPLDDRGLAEMTSDPVIGELVRELGADRVILAPGEANSTQVIDLVRATKTAGVQVSLLPGVLDFIGSRLAFDELNGLTLVSVPKFGLSTASTRLKRSFDLGLAAMGMLVIGPVLLIIAAVIRADSPGPVFFRQIRVGRNGKEFQIVKFRSMVDGAESQKETLRALSEASDGLFKISNDPRVTRVGRFLRKSSLDELPQILNVLRGEMSLVGPRPLVIDEDEAILGLDRSRLSLSPGMTGPWQILPTRLPKVDMIALDCRYADNWSLWLDLKILLRTALHVVGRRNQ